MAGFQQQIPGLLHRTNQECHFLRLQSIGLHSLKIKGCGLWLWNSEDVHLFTELYIGKLTWERGGGGGRGREGRSVFVPPFPLTPSPPRMKPYKTDHSERYYACAPIQKLLLCTSYKYHWVIPDLPGFSRLIKSTKIQKVSQALANITSKVYIGIEVKNG